MKAIDNAGGRNCLTSNMFAIYSYEPWILQNIMNRQGRVGFSNNVCPILQLSVKTSEPHEKWNIRQKSITGILSIVLTYKSFSRHWLEITVGSD